MGIRSRWPAADASARIWESKKITYATGAALVFNNGTCLTGNWMCIPSIPITLNAGEIGCGWGFGSDGGAGGVSSFGSPVTLNAGGEIVLVWGSDAAGPANMIATSTTFNLNGGYLIPFSSNQGNVNHTESYGLVTLGGGQSVYQVGTTGSLITAVSSSGLTRTNNGTVVFNGANMALGATGAPGEIILGSAPVMVGGGTTLATTALNTQIIPWAMGGNAWGTSFVTYDGAGGGNTGVRTLTAGNYDTTASDMTVGGSMGNNFHLAAATTASFSGSGTANSLLFDATNLAAGSNIALSGDGSRIRSTIASGALAFVGQSLASAGVATNTATIGSLGSVNFGPAGTSEAVITVAALCQTHSASSPPTYTGGSLAINASILASALTKSGPGILVLGGPVMFTGGSSLLTIDNGTVQLGAGGQLAEHVTVDLYGSTVGIGANGYLDAGDSHRQRAGSAGPERHLGPRRSEPFRRRSERLHRRRRRRQRCRDQQFHQPPRS